MTIRRRLAAAFAAAVIWPAGQSAGATPGFGVHKIKHIIVIMQENRSFDSYFGTFPGALGIPMKDGAPRVCVPDPTTGACVRPFVDHLDRNGGAPHTAAAAARAIDGGKMDGFIAVAAKGDRRKCAVGTNPNCGQDGGQRAARVMGYHVATGIPNYWAYAKDFVLQDHLFEPVASWSLPAHLYMVSAWSAKCGKQNDPMSCRSDIVRKRPARGEKTPYAWTDLTWLLNRRGVSWASYIDGRSDISKLRKSRRLGKLKRGGGRPLALAARIVPPIWNVLPKFTDVRQDGQAGNIQSIDNYFAAAKAGKLPSVAWVIPSFRDSEHPPARVSVGQSYVTKVINAAMRSPDWKSTAIFLAWDDWGGFYDQVPPPRVDALGYGVRVPGLVISPFAKRGYVDHQTLSFDAYLKFIEDDFLDGARLDPKTDGRPDKRPDVRENAPILGDLTRDFDFNQTPRAPIILPVHPPTSLVSAKEKPTK